MKLQNRFNKKIPFYINSHMSHIVMVDTEVDDDYGHYLDIDEIGSKPQIEPPPITKYLPYRKKKTIPIPKDYYESEDDEKTDPKSLTFNELFYVNVVVFIFVGLVVAEILL